MLFPSNQSSRFRTAEPSISLDTLYTIDLKAFHFSSTVPAGISVSLSFSKACRSSLTVDLDRDGYELPDWNFVFPHTPPHSLFGGGFDHNSKKQRYQLPQQNVLQQEKYPYWQDITQDKKIQQTYNLYLATWNIRTLLDKVSSNRPKRRSPIISKESQKYSIDIMAFNEVRFAESGNIKDDTGSTFNWKG